MDPLPFLADVETKPRWRSRRRGSSATVVAIACAVAACGPLFPSPSNAVDYTLHIDNGTTLALTIVVNGHSVVVAPARNFTDVPVVALPALPWAVEVRSVSGRVILTLSIEPGSVVDTKGADGTSSHRAPGARADLSCGRLDLYPGNVPMMGPPPGPGVPGDCVP